MANQYWQGRQITMTKLYADHKNGNSYIISQDVEKDAIQARMTVEKYIEEIKRLNPQLVKVYIFE